jgi:S-DNA-T family DNA segregation ATPase FtsK/SpoIIIE
MLADSLVGYFNIAGATLLLGVFFLVSLMLVARFSMVLFLEGVLGRFGTWLVQRREAFAAVREKAARDKGERLSAAPVIIRPEPRPLPAPPKEAKKKKKEDEVAQEAFRIPRTVEEPTTIRQYRCSTSRARRPSRWTKMP